MTRSLSRIRGFFHKGLLGLGAALILGGTALAIDPPYEAEMERLTEILGSLYYLQPLCGFTENDWRAQADALISNDAPDADRRQRLNGAFNEGYQAYARLHHTCTQSARAAMERLLTEAEDTARDIHTRFVEQ